MNEQSKGTYKGKPVKEMNKEELIEALENTSNLYWQLLSEKLN